MRKRRRASAKGIAIGMESLLALLIGMSMLTVFYAKFYLDYSGAESHMQSTASMLALYSQMQHDIYLAYYSNLSLASFETALSESGCNCSVVPFSYANSTIVANARMARMVSLQGRVYFVVVK